MLQKVLSEKIPLWQEEIESLLKKDGSAKIGEVSVSQVYGGMRGVKGLICDTSSVSADKGLIIRGRPVSELTHLIPEEAFYLLLTGETPGEKELSDLQGQLKDHQEVPSYVWSVLESLPKGSHPMTMLSVAVQSMRSESDFVDKYNAGMPKSDYWKSALEDGIRLVATLPEIAAGIVAKVATRHGNVGIARDQMQIHKQRCCRRSSRGIKKNRRKSVLEDFLFAV